MTRERPLVVLVIEMMGLYLCSLPNLFLGISLIDILLAITLANWLFLNEYSFQFMRLVWLHHAH